MVEDLIARLNAAGFPDISAGHHPVLENIDPDGTRLTVLAARAEMTHQAVGEVVQTLERRGYVGREPDPTDGRARIVRLTPRGKALASRGLLEIARIEREWTRRWSSAGYTGGDIKQMLRAGLAEAASAARAGGTPVGRG